MAQKTILSTKESILKIIRRIRESHSEITNIFTKGSCFNFYLFLKEIYPDAIAYYDCNHIITKIGDDFYDITGKVIPTANFRPLSEYKDNKLIKRLIKYEYQSERKQCV